MSDLGPNTVAFSSETKERVLSAIKQLPPEMQQVIQSHFFDRLSLGVIGQQLHISEAEAKQAIAEAVRRLTQELAPERK